MKDTSILRRRMRAAVAALPIGAAALAPACGDVDYYEYEELEDGFVDGPKPNVDPPPVVTPDNCENRNRGDFKTEFEDFCFSQGTWNMSVADALGISQEDCIYGMSDEITQGCPREIYLMPLPARGDERQGALTLILRDSDGTTCQYEWYLENDGGCVDEGRALSHGDHAVVATLREGRLWSIDLGDTQDVDNLPEALRTLLGQMWLWSASYEHASIASFARATLELMHHGAPPALLAAAQQAAMEEVKHAQQCFALAETYLGHPSEPAALHSPPARYGTLAELAVETFTEGAAGESVATLVSLRALASCQIPAVREVLSGIVEEESGHAALAWRTVQWAIAKGGSEVARAVRAAADELRPSGDFEDPNLPEDICAMLRAHGRLDPASHEKAARDAWSQLVDPMLEEFVPV